MKAPEQIEPNRRTRGRIARSHSSTAGIAGGSGKPVAARDQQRIDAVRDFPDAPFGHQLHAGRRADRAGFDPDDLDRVAGMAEDLQGADDVQDLDVGIGQDGHAVLRGMGAMFVMAAVSPGANSGSNDKDPTKSCQRA